MKSLLQDKNKPYKDCQRSNTHAQLLNELNHLQEHLNFSKNRSKQNYYAQMTKNLNNVSKSCKPFWSLSRRLLNKKNYLYFKLSFIKINLADSKEEAKFFRYHFATQCSLISNSSKLPSHIHYLTDNRLSSASFSQDKIAKVIQNLDSNKEHGHDNISIHMF